MGVFYILWFVLNMSMSLYSPLEIAIIALSTSSVSCISGSLSLFHSDIAVFFLMQGSMCASFYALGMQFILYSLSDLRILFTKHALSLAFVAWNTQSATAALSVPTLRFNLCLKLLDIALCSIIVVCLLFLLMSYAWPGVGLKNYVWYIVLCFTH